VEARRRASEHNSFFNALMLKPTVKSLQSVYVFGLSQKGRLWFTGWIYIASVVDKNCHGFEQTSEVEWQITS
jgi:hypothetical protein